MLESLQICCLPCQQTLSVMHSNELAKKGLCSLLIYNQNICCSNVMNASLRTAPH
jgi:hypothetical protein